ncbi:hypothetical protein HZS_3612 [Henneguya salminicola]|nr:hypothetical protein HZS_3612 [Henneguya salminicola]
MDCLLSNRQNDGFYHQIRSILPNGVWRLYINIIDEAAWQNQITSMHYVSCLPFSLLLLLSQH